MEKLLEVAWMDPQVGWHRVSGNHQGGGKQFGQVDRDSDLAPACAYRWVEGGLNKRTVAFASTSFRKNAAPAALALKPDNSLPPVCSWHLSSCCPSTGAQRE